MELPAWKRWLLALGFWTAVGLVFAAQSGLAYTYQQGYAPWAFLVRLSLGEWYIWAALSPGVMWLARRFPFVRGRRLRALMVHLPAAFVFTFVKLMIEAQVVWPMLGLRGQPNPVNKFHIALLTYAVIVGASHGIQYYRGYRERELKATQLEARLAEARLDALRTQLQPHFLFNTLHAISALMQRDVEAAERMLSRLGDLLRLTLDASSEQTVPLDREMQFLAPYLEIERTRFPDRLTVETHIAPETLHLRVPTLLLQPLVENAVRHGIAPRAEPGRVEIRSALTDGRLEIEIEDNGRGLPREFRDGLGLSNTRARLEQLYGEAHRFELLPAASGGTLARITLPAQPHDHETREVR